MQPTLTLGRNIPKGARILVAMSGGVDSALAAVLLREAGYEIVGINMRTYHPTAAEKASGRKFQTCCSPEDAGDASAVAAAGDFPFYVLDLEAEFHDAVVKPFIDAYLHGATPNPCALCNTHLKLGVLLDKAHLWNCDFVATGHYAIVEENPATGRVELKLAADSNKDQTYYLFGLSQEQLRKFVCPLGGFTKPEVRELARERGIEIADKAESMEICFVPQNDYRAFLRSKVDGSQIRPGSIVSTQGAVLGRHQGLTDFTVGQRRGIPVPHGPWYVVDLDAENDLVIVGREHETLSHGLLFNRATWIRREAPAPGETIAVDARIRHRHTPVPAVLTATEVSGEYMVRFSAPQKAVTKGQAVVLYENDSVLGGGWIVSRLSAEQISVDSPELDQSVSS